jgi:predicted ATPase
MELLERDTFLADLERLLADAAAGRGRLVFVGGEAGVGKTAFVARVAESARKTASGGRPQQSGTAARAPTRPPRVARRRTIPRRSGRRSAS